MVADIVAGYEKAFAFISEQIEKYILPPVDVTNKENLSKMVRSAVSSKQYGYEDVIAPLIGQAVVDIL